MIDLNQVLDLFQRLDIGRAHFAAKNYELSQKMFESALDLDPKNIPALNNLAAIHIHHRQLAAAKYRISQLFEVVPDDARAMGMAAQVAQEERNWVMAESYFLKSIALDPQNTTTLNNYAYFLQLTGNFHAAIQAYTKARDVNPLDLNIRHCRSMSMLTVAETQAEWDEALSEYEIRHVLVGQKSDYGKPMYQGEYLNGKTLLLVAEQGVGDAVMFGRYANFFAGNGHYPSRLSGYGATINILCRPVLVELMQRIACVSDVASDVKDLPPFDYWLPMMSALKVTGYSAIKADNSPYLLKFIPITGGSFSKGDVISNSGPRLRVGVCWKGNPEHGNDRYRSMSGYTFCEQLRDLDCDLFSLLQPKDNTDKPDYVQECNIGSLVDLADTIASMDLVISVDTAQVHIAGAMGVPVVMASHSNVDFRWGSDGERGKDWYPSMTVFKNTAPLEWTKTLSDIRQFVQEFIDSKKVTYA